MIPWYSAQDSCSRLQGFLFFFGGRVAQSRDTNETCECAGKKSDEHFVTMEFGRKIWVVGLTLTKTVVFFFQFLCNRQWVSWPRTDGFFRGNGRRWIRRAMDVSHGLPNFSGMIHQDFFFGEVKACCDSEIWVGPARGSGLSSQVCSHES